MIISITEPKKTFKETQGKWFVYILQCCDNSLYTGVTNNLEKRIQTKKKKKGAKYTRSRLPVVLKYYEIVNNKSSALKREISLKKLTREQKLQLISTK